MITLLTPININAHIYFFIASTNDAGLRYISEALTKTGEGKPVRLITPCGDCFELIQGDGNVKPEVKIISGTGSDILTSGIIICNPLLNWNRISPDIFSAMINTVLFEFDMKKSDLYDDLAISRQQIHNISKSPSSVKQTVFQSLLFTIARMQNNAKLDDKRKVELVFDNVTYNHEFDGISIVISKITCDTGVLAEHLYEVVRYINSTFDDAEERCKYDLDMSEFILPACGLENCTSVKLEASCYFERRISVTDTSKIINKK